jgi:hypothetical protein
MANTKGGLRMLSMRSIVGDDSELALKFFPQILIRGNDGQVLFRRTVEARPFEIQERIGKDSARSRATAKNLASSPEKP